MAVLPAALHGRLTGSMACLKCRQAYILHLFIDCLYMLLMYKSLLFYLHTCTLDCLDYVLT